MKWILIVQIIKSYFKTTVLAQPHCLFKLAPFPIPSCSYLGHCISKLNEAAGASSGTAPDITGAVPDTCVGKHREGIATSTCREDAPKQKSCKYGPNLSLIFINVFNSFFNLYHRQNRNESEKKKTEKALQISAKITSKSSPLLK